MNKEIKELIDSIEQKDVESTLALWDIYLYNLENTVKTYRQMIEALKIKLDILNNEENND